MADENEGAKTSTDATASASEASGAGTGEAGDQATQQQDGPFGPGDTSEGKAAEGTDGGEEAEGQDGEKAEGEAGEGVELTGAPEGDYEQFNVPEGMLYDEEGAKLLGEYAKKLNLSQAGAQGLVDLHMQMIQGLAQKQWENELNMMEQWQAETNKQFGNDLPKVSGAANRVLKAFGAEGFAEMLLPYDAEKNPTGMGLGKNPAVLATFAAIAKAISPDNPEFRGSDAPSKNEEKDTETWLREDVFGSQGG